MKTAVLYQQNNDEMGSQKSETAIEHLVETLGLADACELLQSALHLIVERQEELGAALKQGDVITAKRCAHRTIGSVRLYGSDRLETMLFEIGNKSLDVINTEAFQQELSAEFDSVISNVNTWLLKHS